MTRKLDLFGEPAGLPALPAGFRYAPDVISEQLAQRALPHLQSLPFEEFDFHGYKGKRRVVSFGWHYDFGARRLRAAEAIPDFLIQLREPAAAFACLDAEELRHVLVTEYDAGAAIGWHKDKAVFGDVVGLSFLAPCTFRFRRATGGKWERRKVTLEPLSGYLLSGPARIEWEHSIPAVEELRYSVTFRTLRGKG